MTEEHRDRSEAQIEAPEVTRRSGPPIDEVVREIRRSNPSLIALDGLPGAGKSRLALDLSARLKIRCVHLDHYLAPDPVGFTDYLDYEALQSALSDRPVIVEGVCLLAVLDRLALRPDQFIYLDAPFAARQLDRSHPLLREVRTYTERVHPADEAQFNMTRFEPEAARHNTRGGWQATSDAYLSRNRSHISVGLVVLGVIMLAVGATLVGIGSTSQIDPLTQATGRDRTLIGAGILTMLLSSLWIALARFALPTRRVQASPRLRK